MWFNDPRKGAIKGTNNMRLLLQQRGGVAVYKQPGTLKNKQIQPRCTQYPLETNCCVKTAKNVCSCNSVVEGAIELKQSSFSSCLNTLSCGILS